MCRKSLFHGPRASRASDQNLAVAGLPLILEFYNHDFDGFVANIDVLVQCSWSVGVEPVCLAGVPLMHLTLTRLLQNIHRSAAQRNDDARMLVPMHG
jgi:hypothetical protein